MTDDHAPEGRTAHECFELARIALDQAEQVVNRATTTLECAKAQASASIAIGWARLGDALANEPRELDPVTWTTTESFVSDAMNTHRFDPHEPLCSACKMTRGQAALAAGRGQICRPGPHWQGPIPIRLPADLDPKMNPTTRMSPAHEHGLNCRHQWITPSAPCANGCGAMPEGFYIGRSPSEVCPKSTCLDVTA